MQAARKVQVFPIRFFPDTFRKQVLQTSKPEINSVYRSVFYSTSLKNGSFDHKLLKTSPRTRRMEGFSTKSRPQQKDKSVSHERSTSYSA